MSAKSLVFRLVRVVMVKKANQPAGGGGFSPCARAWRWDSKTRLEKVFRKWGAHHDCHDYQ